jgi:hypothetical protein
VKEKVTNAPRREFDWKTTAKSENERRKNAPKIKLNQIQPKSVEKTKSSNGLGQGRRVRHYRKDNPDQSPNSEKEGRATQLWF